MMAVSPHPIPADSRVSNQGSAREVLRNGLQGLSPVVAIDDPWEGSGNRHSWVDPIQWNLFTVGTSGLGTCPPPGPLRYRGQALTQPPP